MSHFRRLGFVLDFLFNTLFITLARSKNIPYQQKACTNGFGTFATASSSDNQYGTPQIQFQGPGSWPDTPGPSTDMSPSAASSTSAAGGVEDRNIAHAAAMLKDTRLDDAITTTDHGTSPTKAPPTAPRTSSGSRPPSPQTFATKLALASALLHHGHRPSPILIYHNGSLREVSLGDPSSPSDEFSADKWHPHLPIYGTIALRRAVARGHDVVDIKRQQWFQWQHDFVRTKGELRDVYTSFGVVEWAPEAEEVVRKREKRGRSVSAGSRPSVEDMTAEEWVGKAHYG